MYMNGAHSIYSVIALMKYTAKGINASNMLVKTQSNPDIITLRESKNKENKIRLHINEQEGNALK